MLYAFWYGRSRISKQEVREVNDAIGLLRNDEWEGSTPVYINGSGFAMNDYRQLVALQLLEALRTNTSAKTLILQNVKLTQCLRNALTRVFQDNTSLRVIRLHKVQNGTVDATADTAQQQQQQQQFVVPACLFSNASSLEEVSLEGCGMDCMASTALARMLAKTDCALKRLLLNNVCYSSPRDLSRILEGVRANASVKELHVERLHDVGGGHADDFASDVARTVAVNETLRTLSLRNNGLGPDFVRVLMRQGLKYNDTLRALFLSRNPLGDLGARYVLEGLLQHQRGQQPARCCSLRELSLVHAGIGREGCRAVARGLAAAVPSLRKLSLDDNDFIDCAPEFLESLQTNFHLCQIVECPSSITTLSGGKNASSSRNPTKQARAREEWSKVDLFLRWNQANRRALAQREPVLSPALLPRILNGASAEPDLLYQFVRELPCLAQQQHYCDVTAPRQKQQHASSCSTKTTMIPRQKLVTTGNCNHPATKVQHPAQAEVGSSGTTSSLASFMAASPASLSNALGLPQQQQPPLPSTTTTNDDTFLPGGNIAAGGGDRHAFMTNLLASAMRDLGDL